MNLWPIQGTHAPAQVQCSSWTDPVDEWCRRRWITTRFSEFYGGPRYCSPKSPLSWTHGQFHRRRLLWKIEFEKTFWETTYNEALYLWYECDGCNNRTVHFVRRTDVKILQQFEKSNFYNWKENHNALCGGHLYRSASNGLKRLERKCECTSILPFWGICAEYFPSMSIGQAPCQELGHVK